MRVLLVEDVPATAELLAHVLRSIPPVESVTWRATVPKKVEDRYDLVVMDLGMKGYEGAGALRALREFAPSVSVIVYTDGGQADSEAADLGAAVVRKGDLVPAIVAAFAHPAPAAAEALDTLRRRAAEAVRHRFDSSESGVRLVQQKARERITEVRKRIT